ncbi:hypothetical protein MHU86_20521 [Fragilaria crotonensis]|nr:hypothetical protein MHU86_20521 [Fragilaria crotonensis]
MGNIVSLSRDDWSAWTGGKPAPGWVGLDPSAADDITSPNQLRPVHASASQKGYNFRRTGMTTLFTQASSLVDFQNAVWDHLVDCGMDTIAYLPDPESSSVMTNVVRSHSHTVATAKTLSSQQLLRYDKYDKSNDLAATKFSSSSRSRSHEQDQREDGRRRLVSRRLAPAHQDDPVDVDRALRRPEGRDQGSPPVPVRRRKP